MRRVKRMLADEDYLNEIARQRRLAAPSGAVIAVEMPIMSESPTDAIAIFAT